MLGKLCICFWGGSPRIYAGIGALQRSGRDSIFKIMRFSAGVGKPIQLLLLKGTAFTPSVKD